MNTRSFTISSRSTAHGGGWKLCLLEDDQEVGGGVFPPQKTDGELADYIAYCEAFNTAQDHLGDE